MKFTMLESLLTPKNHKHISIEEYVGLIKNNLFIDKINSLRDLVYKSNEYTKLKETLPCIITSGEFDGLKINNLINLNGLIYFDIDNIINIEKLIDTLINFIPVFLLYKSPSGKGIHFFIKVDNLDINNFKMKQDFICNYLINNGFNVDISAKGIARKAFISYDENVYYNNCSLSVESIGFKEGINRVYNSIEGGDIEPIDTFSKKEFKIIDIATLLTQINVKTKYEGEIEGVYKIDKQEVKEIIFPRKISDGKKHTTFRRIIMYLMDINKGISELQVISFMVHINHNHTTVKMEKDKLMSLCKNTYSWVKNNDVKLASKVKTVQFNKNVYLTPKEKMSIGAKVGGELRSNKTKSLIEDEINRLSDLNIKPTQKQVAENLKLSIATVKRYWKGINRVYNNIEGGDIEPNDTFLDNKSIIEPNDTFEVTYKWKGFKEVNIVITNKDKELFKEMIQILEDNDLSPCETLLLDLNMMDKYKLDYLYNMWIKKYGYNDISQDILNDK